MAAVDFAASAVWRRLGWDHVTLVASCHAPYEASFPRAIHRAAKGNEIWQYVHIWMIGCHTHPHKGPRFPTLKGQGPPHKAWGEGVSPPHLVCVQGFPQVHLLAEGEMVDGKLTRSHVQVPLDLRERPQATPPRCDIADVHPDLVGSHSFANQALPPAWGKEGERVKGECNREGEKTGKC